MKKIFLTSLAVLLLSVAGWAIADSSAGPKPDKVEVTTVDLTEKLANPNFNDGTNGWTVNTGKIEVKAASTGNPVVTAYGYQVNISQQVTGLEPGKYRVKVQACSRYMDKAAGIKDYETRKANGQEIPNEAYVYANGEQKKVVNIWDETSTYDFAKESGQAASDLTMSNGEQIPYNSTNFANAFNAGMYENELDCTVGADGVLTLGIKNELTGDGYQPYVGYDNFRLYKINEVEEYTSQLANPNFNDGTNGWTINTGKIEVKAASTGNPVVTAYGYQVDICQKVTGLKPGKYVVKVQACSRYMDKAAGIKDYETRKANGQEIPNEAYVYANGEQKKVVNIWDETSTYDFAKESGQAASDLTMSNGEQIPYNSTNFANAFNAGMYENELACVVGKDGELTVGIKNLLTGDGYQPYVGYDNFRLYRVGDLTEEDAPVDTPEVVEGDRIAIPAGSANGSELNVEVLEKDANGNTLSAKYTVKNGTWGNNASHLSIFKFAPLSAETIKGYEKIVVMFDQVIPASNGEATYGFIPVGLVSPVNWTSMSGRDKWEYTFTDDDKAKGIDDFSIFFNASGDLKDIEFTIKGIYLVKAAGDEPGDEPEDDMLDVTGFEDLTAKLANPNFNDGTNGWTVNEGKIEVKAASTGNPVVTAYNYQVDICQTVEGLEPGKYAVLVQACSRHMDKEAGIKDYENNKAQGKEIQNEAYVYANGVQKKVKNIYDEGADYDFATESGQSVQDLRLANGKQIPYNSTNFANAFGKFNMYQNYVICTVGKNGVLNVGIKNELQAGGNIVPYLAYDNFRLYRMGDAEEEEGPAFELYDLKANAGDYVAVCMPYEVKSEYFGQVYQIAEIQGGKAVIVPVESVATGVPCVVKATGENNIKEGDVTLSYTTPKAGVSLWDNTMMQGDLNKLTWTATAVDGSDIKVADLTYVEADLAHMDFTCTIENNAAARFWAQNPEYAAETPTAISKYINLPTCNRTDQPNPISIPVVVSEAAQTLQYCLTEDMVAAETVTVPAGKSVAEIYNLLPGLTYYYKSVDGKSAGKFTVGGKLRMMMIGKNVVNMRDLGGKKTVDGRYVKYGKLYRNAEFRGNTFSITDAELQALLALNIGAEVDLRNEDGNKPWLPKPVRDENFYWAQGKNYIANGPGKMYDKVAIPHLKAEFELIVKNLKLGHAVDFHCRIGADRTGFLAFLLEGLLGVSEADILLDYETTSFSEAGLRTKADGDGDAAASSYEKVIPAEFRSKIPEGGTLRDVFEAYFINTLGVDKTLIDEYREIMLGDTPLPDMNDGQMAACVELLDKEVKNAELYVFGEEYGQYTLADQASVDKYKSAVESASALLGKTEGVGLDAVKDCLKSVVEARDAMVAANPLNMPKAGDKFNIKSKSYNKTVVPTSKNNNWTMYNFTAAKCIFTFDGTNVVNDKTGFVFGYDAASGLATGAEAEAGVVAATLVPSQASTPGCYNIKIGNYTLVTCNKADVNLTVTDMPDSDADVILVKVDAGGDGVQDVEMAAESVQGYNLAGQKVGAGYKGIVVSKGRKTIVK
ncbi:MAG: tyrosine-protein phosphatase [Bacteroidaceae bacterium]|nr:tyrosine-protein phosphatase [Bacteroidaceae bacterium]